eukprot:TRINITY_DN5535_c0_g1_i5.p1 TRINITY_DN5535_c0_g1~~TRINITY_DN5535_c0_g1_i5.p1  ORF type:complete len:435 (-),score=33.51 TRINITY_DN5535_c0_g1_i5:290-1594(-)
MFATPPPSTYQNSFSSLCQSTTSPSSFQSQQDPQIKQDGWQTTVNSDLIPKMQFQGQQCDQLLVEAMVQELKEQNLRNDMRMPQHAMTNGVGNGFQNTTYSQPIPRLGVLNNDLGILPIRQSSQQSPNISNVSNAANVPLTQQQLAQRLQLAQYLQTTQQSQSQYLLAQEQKQRQFQCYPQRYVPSQQVLPRNDNMRVNGSQNSDQSLLALLASQLVCQSSFASIDQSYDEQAQYILQQLGKYLAILDIEVSAAISAGLLGGLGAADLKILQAAHEEELARRHYQTSLQQTNDSLNFGNSEQPPPPLPTQQPKKYSLTMLSPSSSQIPSSMSSLYSSNSIPNLNPIQQQVPLNPRTLNPSLQSVPSSISNSMSQSNSNSSSSSALSSISRSTSNTSPPLDLQVDAVDSKKRTPLPNEEAFQARFSKLCLGTGFA